MPDRRIEPQLVAMRFALSLIPPHDIRRFDSRIARAGSASFGLNEAGSTIRKDLRCQPARTAARARCTSTTWKSKYIAPAPRSELADIVSPFLWSNPLR